MKKLLLLAGAMAIAGCSAADTTAPARQMAPRAAARDFTCRSGYEVAYDQQGNPYCVPVDQGTSAKRQP